MPVQVSIIDWIPAISRSGMIEFRLGSRMALPCLLLAMA